MAVLELLLLVVHAIQFLFAIIVLGLTGHVASYGATPSQDSFMIFVAVWTLIIVLYTALTPKLAPSLAHVLAIFALNALTTLFWFAAFIALAVFYHDLENSAVIFGDGFFFEGADQTCSVIGSYCHQIEAATVFGAFEWALFVISTILAGLEGFHNHKGRGTTANTTTA
ncbi:hypothetical protein P7C71_g2105, partial [Lecanoromycetidae sp. Uapishka_2]